ncbi:hypothetical protein AMS68_000748 [Peltaster fructicola]|uniref:Pre-mRNA-processing factor 19 n=1 Tax=Peltaster fructicola TaxID=286661 RepID=A0A6H0XKS4_9PEZI|nr:hypothetical protein AMS68_000748 [Peltaster fructicola]
MLCAISGEAPLEPVTSRKSGNVFEKRLIEAYISEHGRDPVNGEELNVDDLIELKNSRVVRPRPPTLTSIPTLLSTFQNEWDALVLEAYTLKQELAETRQELSTALYYNDAAQKVIARLQTERDEARDALARLSITAGNSANGSNGDGMQVDAQGLTDAIKAKIEQTQQELSSTRRKRPVPADWATGESIASYEFGATVDTQFTGAKALAVDSSGDMVLTGDSDGAVAVYDIKQGAFVTRSNLGAGAITGGAWARDATVFSTANGAVVVANEGNATATFHQHAGVATDVAVHPTGEIIASVGADKSYVLYDLAGSVVLTQVYTDTELTTVAFHPDGHLLAAGGKDGSIKLYSSTTSQLAHTFSPSSADPITAIAFSENGTWIASASQNSTSVVIWDLRKLNQLISHDVGTTVAALTWDYTGQFLAAAGPGGVVVKQYEKKSKEWTEPLRKAVNASNVSWAAHAKSLVTLTNEGSISILGPQ